MTRRKNKNQTKNDTSLLDTAVAEMHGQRGKQKAETAQSQQTANTGDDATTAETEHTSMDFESPSRDKVLRTTPRNSSTRPLKRSKEAEEAAEEMTATGAETLESPPNIAHNPEGLAEVINGSDTEQHDDENINTHTIYYWCNTINTNNITRTKFLRKRN